MYLIIQLCMFPECTKKYKRNKIIFIPNSISIVFYVILFSTKQLSYHFLFKITFELCLIHFLCLNIAIKFEVFTISEDTEKYIK